MQATSRFLVAFAAQQSNTASDANGTAASADGDSTSLCDQHGIDVSRSSTDQGTPQQVPAAFINYRFEPGYHGEPVL
jgi:hypothetical protein